MMTAVILDDDDTTDIHDRFIEKCDRPVLLTCLSVPWMSPVWSWERFRTENDLAVPKLARSNEPDSFTMADETGQARAGHERHP